MPFVETKRHLNKPTQTFPCTCLARGDDWVLLKYVSTKSYEICGAFLPQGTVTFAFYKMGGHCIVWRMVAPDGCLMGHLFHISKDLEMSDQGLSYLDLLLDVWVDPSGNTTLLDEEELAACVEKGTLSQAQAAEIRGFAETVLDGWQDWVAVLEGCLNKSGT